MANEPSAVDQEESQQAPPAELLYRGVPEDNFALLRKAVEELSQERGWYSGCPMPLDGEELILEPSHPCADILDKKTREEETIKVRNSFFVHRYGLVAHVFDKPDGKVALSVEPASHARRVDMLIKTLGCSAAWGVAQEGKAMELLGDLLPGHAFKYYLLTGTFLESSKRSGVTYMFRKLRPTIALSARTDSVRILCTLCMHPIGYYSETWAGAMCPTDDVIAHLMLMRGDEHMFWRRCNQHPSDHPQSGLY